MGMDMDLKASPIDVNIPDLNAMLFDWKPTGPKSILIKSYRPMLVTLCS